MISDALKGVLLGGCFGGLAGLGACIWLIPGDLLFPGDTILFGAVICGIGGYIGGDAFFEWLGENWWWFS